MIPPFFRKAVATVLAVALFIPAQVFGATQHASDVVSASTVMYMEIDLTQLLSVADYFFQQLNEDTAGSTKSHLSERHKVMTDIYTSRRLYVAASALDSFSSDSITALIPITDAQWTKLLPTYPDAVAKQTSNHTYYYSEEEDTYLANVNGFLVIASEDAILSLFSSYDKGDFLSSSSQYLNTVKKLSSGNFFTMYLDYQSLLSTLDGKMNAIKNLAIAAQKIHNGAQIQTVSTKGPDAHKLYSPFLPYLYTYATAKDPMLYYEGYNFKKVYESMIEQLGGASALDLDEVSEELQDELGFDPLNDIINLLLKGYSFTVDDNASSVIPNFTFMADVQGSEAAAKNFLKTSAAKLRTTLKGQEEMVTVIGSSTIGGSDFTLVINLPEIDPDYALGEGSNTLTLRFEVTKDNILVISSDNALISRYGTGLNTADFGDQISNAQTIGLLSVDLREIANLIKRSVESQYKTLSSEDQKLFKVNTILQRLDTITAPWQKIISYSSSDATSVTSTMQALFSNAVYSSEYWSQVEDAWTTISKAGSRLSRVKVKFSDVESSAWFDTQVKMLKSYGIVKGYYDIDRGGYQFQPSKPVTRAEFLAMLYRGVEGDTNFFDDYSGFSENPPPVFKDVDFYDWHYDIVMKAQAKNLVKGFGDGTFRPNQTISRAEAVAMLARFYEHYNDLEIFVDLPFRKKVAFSDVADSMWFAEPVSLAYELNVVNGTAPGLFQPAKILNRAEAATMIYNLLRLKFERDI